MSSEEYLRIYVMEDVFTTASPPPDPFMDSAVWSRLPYDILRKILLHLPTACQARFRSVSKAWRLTLESEEFQQISAFLAVCSGRFLCGLVCRMDRAWSQDEHMHYHARHKVLKLSFPYLPSFYQNCLQDMSRKGSFFIQNGLIALITREKDYGICIINPMNQTWKELPSPGVTQASEIAGISVVREEGGSAATRSLSTMPPKRRQVRLPIPASLASQPTTWEPLSGCTAV